MRKKPPNYNYDSAGWNSPSRLELIWIDWKTRSIHGRSRKLCVMSILANSTHVLGTNQEKEKNSPVSESTLHSRRYLKKIAVRARLNSPPSPVASPSIEGSSSYEKVYISKCRLSRSSRNWVNMRKASEIVGHRISLSRLICLRIICWSLRIGNLTNFILSVH